MGPLSITITAGEAFEFLGLFIAMGAAFYAGDHVLAWLVSRFFGSSLPLYCPECGQYCGPDDEPGDGDSDHGRHQGDDEQASQSSQHGGNGGGVVHPASLGGAE